MSDCVRCSERSSDFGRCAFDSLSSVAAIRIDERRKNRPNESLEKDKIARKRAQKIEKRERSKRRRIAAGSSASPGTAQDATPEKAGASATASATLNKTFKKSIPLPEALAPATTNAARDLERRGVRMVYDAVAQQWDGTRWETSGLSC